MYGLFYECKFLTIEEEEKEKITAWPIKYLAFIKRRKKSPAPLVCQWPSIDSFKGGISEWEK